MKTITLLAIAGSLAVAAPATAAETSPSTPSSSSLCKAERTAVGSATFALTYGTNANRSNAFGKCVSSRNALTAKADTAAKTNAAKACKTEEAADAGAFAAKYGTGKNKKNAFGKCVSGKAKSEKAAIVKAQTKDNINGAKACKAERGTTDASKAAFAAKYRNFGKCVSAAAKAAAAARA